MLVFIPYCPFCSNVVLNIIERVLDYVKWWLDPGKVTAETGQKANGNQFMY